MKPVKEYLSPKEVAAVVGASESSIKRWIDEGRIAAVKTPGGHRRIPASAVAELLRSRGHEMQDPAPLGISQPTSWAALSSAPEDEVSQFTAAIKDGDLITARDLALSRYFRGSNAADLCTQLIQPGWGALRADCPHPSEGCFTLHRARGLCYQVIDAIKPFVRNPEATIAATGADIGYEIDALPSAVCDLVLLEAGLVTASLGNSVAQPVLTGTIRERRAPVFWLSGNGPCNRDELMTRLRELDRIANEVNTTILVIGDAWPAQLPSELTRSTRCQEWRDVLLFGRGLVAAG